MTWTTGGAYVIDRHDTTRADAITSARTWLTTGGATTEQADDALVDRPGLVVRAWWGGDAVGFVGADFPGASPVTVVNVGA